MKISCQSSAISRQEGATHLSKSARCGAHGFGLQALGSWFKAGPPPPIENCEGWAAASGLLSCQAPRVPGFEVQHTGDGDLVSDAAREIFALWVARREIVPR